ncbi:MAG: efflux RND transporter permease subunit [Defluviitaleaceae bacterium]|nr:efflux RND transporter permease subunit [Defluviitaleaceae bacterium]
MLEKFSVRKPFTVLVGVLLITVLGIVSFINTSTDLLPAMDLPFSAVITIYPGATPEEVERDISVPLETRMSTLSGIQMVQSISSEMFSLVILEFTEATNMDSASLEIREALDMMTLPDGAMRPMTIRMNPAMLPILTANLFMEGATIDELSEFARYEVAPVLEGVPGVAVVSLSGLVQNQLNVIIRGDYIEAINENMAHAIEAMAAAMATAMMAEAAAMAEPMITALVEEIAEARMEELMAEGYSFDDASMIVNLDELDGIIEFATAEVMAYLAEGQAAMFTEMPEIGLPAEMLTVEAINGLLFANNFAMPAGMIIDEDISYMVRVGDRFETLYDIKNMLIFDPNIIPELVPLGLAPVRLSDIAYVFETDDSHLSFTRVNGNPAVMLSVQRQSEFTTADIASAVRERMEHLMDEHPGLGFSVLMDQGEMIDLVIDSVLGSLLWGGLLAIVILLFFLRDLRPTFIVAISIPVSIMLAFALMYFTGVSLNMISMGGLALAVGMLVDNSIVVIENIFRMRASTDRSCARAAVSGAKQVSGAIAAATLTTISLFVPIVFTGGITRQIFTDFALTITFALLASLVIALTVVPSACSVMLKKVKRVHEGAIFSKFVDGYEKSLRVALRFKVAVLIVAIAAFVLSLWAIGRQGMEMFPAMDMGEIFVSVEIPEGTTFEDAKGIAEELSDRIFAIADTETVGVSIGGGMMEMLAAGMGMGGMAGPGGTASSIDIYIILADDRTITIDELNTQIREIGESLGVVADVGGADDMMTMMMGDPISLRVEGTELDDIRDTAIALAALVESVPGAINVTDMTEQAAPEVRVTVRKDDAMAHGLPVALVLAQVAEAINEPMESMQMMLSGRSYEVIITDGDFSAPGKAEIANLQISTPMGGVVTLSDIAYVHEDFGFTSINRMNRNRFVTVSGEIAEGYNVGLVNDEIYARLESFETYGNTRIIIGGEAEAIAEAFGDLILMLALGLLFTYLIMVAQFQSLLSPFVIMFTVPLAFTGGFAGLLVAGMPLSIVAMIGLIVLSGIAVNNGIVLVSRITQMRWEGMGKIDAIIDAGRKRIRPILMTAISTVFAMSVLALGIGEGTEMMQPMAIATIGGLIYATIMTLYVVPAIYDLLHRNKDITVENLDDEE